MSLFMDVRHLYGDVIAADVAGVYGVNYQHHWVDASRGQIFCLVDAPDSETGARVRREAHERVADEIYEVTQGA